MEEAGSARLCGLIEPDRSHGVPRSHRRRPRAPSRRAWGRPGAAVRLVHFDAGPIGDRYELSAGLAELFKEELLELERAGYTYLQYEDLGAWTPNLTGEGDFAWARGHREPGHARRHRVQGLALLPRQCVRQPLRQVVRGGCAGVLPLLRRRCRRVRPRLRVPRDGRGVHAVGHPRALPSGHRGIDVRTLEIEQPEQVATRIRAILERVELDRVTLTTDCAMKQLPAAGGHREAPPLAQGAEIVRKARTGPPEPVARRHPRQARDRAPPTRAAVAQLPEIACFFQPIGRSPSNELPQPTLRARCEAPALQEPPAGPPPRQREQSGLACVFDCYSIQHCIHGIEPDSDKPMLGNQTSRSISDHIRQCSCTFAFADQTAGLAERWYLMRRAVLSSHVERLLKRSERKNGRRMRMHNCPDIRSCAHQLSVNRELAVRLPGPFEYIASRRYENDSGGARRVDLVEGQPPRHHP